MVESSITSASEGAGPRLEPAARRLLRRAALLAVALAALLLASEWLYRGLLFGPAALLHPGDYSPASLGQAIGVVAASDSAMALPPGVVGRYRGRRFSTDRLGFRNPPFDPRKAPGVVRIAVLGVSIDMGAGVADDEPYPRLLEEKLRALAPGRFEALNLSLPGPSAARQAAIYEQAAARLDADVILLPLHLGGDEAAAAFDPKAAQSFAEGLRQHFYLLQALRAANDLMFDALDLERWAPLAQTAAVRTILPPSPLDPRLIRRIRADGRAVMLVPLLRPRHNAPTPRDLQTIAQYADAFAQDPCVFVLRALRGQLGRIGRWDTVYPGDDHPDARVHRVYADAIFEALSPALAAAASCRR